MRTVTENGTFGRVTRCGNSRTHGIMEENGSEPIQNDIDAISNEDHVGLFWIVRA